MGKRKFKPPIGYEEKEFTEEKPRIVGEEERIEDVVHGDVPLYRSYGVTKRYNPVTIKLKNFFARLVTLFVLSFYLFVLLIVFFFFWWFSGELIATVVTLILGTVIYLVTTRVPRARRRFVKKLKKLCRKQKFKLEFKRGFWQSMTWADEGKTDFILHAGKYTYYVRYATATKSNSTMTFMSETQLVYTKHPRNNKYTIIFDFKDKRKTMKISFPDDIDRNDKYSIKAILINPVPMDIEKKGDYTKGIEPTGTGEKLFGYTIFNGTGFLEELKRNGEEIKNKE